MTEPFRPLSVRGKPEQEREYDALHEGVPEWLVRSVIDWLAEYFNPDGLGKERWQRSQLHNVETMLRTTLDWTQYGTDSSSVEAAISNLLTRARDHEEFALDLMDFALRRTRASSSDGATLRKALHQGGSAWTVGQEGDYCSLQRRVDTEVQAMADAARADGAPAGQFLSGAWAAAWGRQPNPSNAYRDAVRAVEAAVIPIVQPNHGGATLGTVLGELRANPSKFRLQLRPKDGDAVAVFTDMLGMLWTAQLDRHPTADPSQLGIVSQPEAEAAVTLAALILTWAQSGGFEAK